MAANLAAAPVAYQLEADGFTIVLNARVQAAEEGALFVQQNGAEDRIAFGKILVAVGRCANTAGLNEMVAQENIIPYEVTRYGIDDLDRAIADGEAHGFVKVLTRPGGSGKILGVTIVGYHAS